MSDKNIIQTPLAGSWYSADPQTLGIQFDRYFSNVPQGNIPDCNVIVAPHAGYTYSGQTAAYAFSAIRNKQYKTAIILAPSHRVAFSGIGIVPVADAFSTPLGVIPVNHQICDKLLATGYFKADDRVHQYEHSAQIQFPFLQYLQNNISVVPIIFGSLSDKDTDVLAGFIRSCIDEDVLLILSTDFIHFGSDFDYQPFPVSEAKEKCEAINLSAWKEMESCSRKGFEQVVNSTEATICGREPIRVMLSMFPKGSKGHFFHYANSSDDGGDYSRFVCYLAGGYSICWNAEDKEFLSSEDKKKLLHLARQTIRYALETGRIPNETLLNLPDGFITDAMRRKMGAFVTLHVTANHNLRGCIGEIQAYRPLYQAVIGRAVDAAFRDPRFPQLSSFEFSKITLEISALTPEHPVDSWKDIVIGKHGMTLSKNGRSAVFLPQVAPEQGWDIAETLTNLSLKAGLPPDAWREGASFTVFEAIVFSEK